MRNLIQDLEILRVCVRRRGERLLVGSEHWSGARLGLRSDDRLLRDTPAQQRNRDDRDHRGRIRNPMQGI